MSDNLTKKTTAKKSATKKSSATAKKTTTVKKATPKKTATKKTATKKATTKKVATRKPTVQNEKVVTAAELAAETKSTARVASPEHKTNVIGLIGLIFASIAVFIGWLPLFGWLIWLAGLILSTVGVVSKPRTTSIIGLVLSFVAFIGIIMFLLILANN